MRVSFRAVTKRMGPRVALDGVELDVPSGESLAVIGPSGCGKSTLLRLVAGLLFADRGEVTVGDTVIAPSTAPALRRGMGYVIQEGGLFPHLTVQQNVLLSDQRAPLAAADRAARLDEVITMTRLDPELLARLPGELSGGQRQRVGLARALYHRPALLLLDEPFGALDPLVRAELQDEVASMVESTRTTTLLVTHDVAEAAIVASRIALLREGAIEQIGTLRELVEAPRSEFVTRFLHSAKGVGDLLERSTP